MTTRPSSYGYDDIIKGGEGTLLGEGAPLLPLPPMLMFDRITNLDETGGAHGKGGVTAEFDVNPDLWFFKCHFKGDPVMPGCLGLDATWQLTGFFLGWLGHKGKGRALGVGEVKLKSMITPDVKLVTYQVDFTRVIARKLIMGVADGKIYADGELAFDIKGMKVGLFGAEEEAS